MATFSSYVFVCVCVFVCFWRSGLRHMRRCRWQRRPRQASVVVVVSVVVAAVVAAVALVVMVVGGGGGGGGGFSWWMGQRE